MPSCKTKPSADCKHQTFFQLISLLWYWACPLSPHVTTTTLSEPSTSLSTNETLKKRLFAWRKYSTAPNLVSLTPSALAPPPKTESFSSKPPAKYSAMEGSAKMWIDQEKARAESFDLQLQRIAETELIEQWWILREAGDLPACWRRSQSQAFSLEREGRWQGIHRQLGVSREKELG